jgi:hypothetical protein
MAGMKKNLRRIFTSIASYLNSATKLSRIDSTFTKLDLFEGNRDVAIWHASPSRNHPQLHVPLRGVAPIKNNNLVRWNPASSKQILLQTGRASLRFALSGQSTSEGFSPIKDNSPFGLWLVSQLDRKIIQPGHLVLTLDVAALVKRSSWLARGRSWSTAEQY